MLLGADRSQVARARHQPSRACRDGKLPALPENARKLMTYCEVIIQPIDSLPIDRLSPVVTEAAASGFHALSRLLSEWTSGQNRFNKPGEALFIAIEGERVVGVCGLNRDPYLSDQTVGRIRHLYVAVDHRRKGIGSRLVQTIMELARRHFARLRLRTGSPDADRFYRSLGFMPVTGDPACSHQLVFIDEGQPPIPLVRL
jgi:GNAT superfamily N-acetyltransferase